MPYYKSIQGFLYLLMLKHHLLLMMTKLVVCLSLMTSNIHLIKQWICILIIFISHPKTMSFATMVTCNLVHDKWTFSCICHMWLQISHKDYLKISIFFLVIFKFILICYRWQTLKNYAFFMIAATIVLISIQLLQTHGLHMALWLPSLLLILPQCLPSFTPQLFMHLYGKVSFQMT